MKQIISMAFLLIAAILDAQSIWPSGAWNTGDNLTPVMDAAGITDLSGLHWNPVTNRLYCVQGDGRLRVLQMDSSAMGFTQIANKPLADGPEGITQVNFSANEFYTIDENSYEIRKFTHNGSFGALTQARHWNLLLAPSPMPDTGNTGPEGIVFVPDDALIAAGFVSQQTGDLYTSTKGMGGLMFVAHQDGGFVWVFDLNPGVTNDFAYVGKYKTNRLESCDLAFDRTTGVLYILHNIGANYLETTHLSSVVTSGTERKFTTLNEYFIANPPDSNSNIEGFALMPKCPSGVVAGAWLARDVEINEDDGIQQDCLRWFSPFSSDGNCALSVDQTPGRPFVVYPNPGKDEITISSSLSIDSVRIIDNLGQTVKQKQGVSESISLDVSQLACGSYILEIGNGGMISRVKWIKS